jgi:hypothetical protein
VYAVATFVDMAYQLARDYDEHVLSSMRIKFSGPQCSRRNFIMADGYALNESQVACDVLKADVILVHFGSGLYYNMHGLAAEIFKSVHHGYALPEVARSLSEHYGIPKEQVDRDLRELVEELVREELLVRTDQECPQPSIIWQAPAYERPRCEKFDDMADQLLLDKINDPSQNAQWAPASM